MADAIKPVRGNFRTTHYRPLRSLEDVYKRQLLLGVAFANLFMGIPIDGNGVYHGNIIKLLNPYGLAGGIFFVLIFCMHGALWLALKSEGDIHERAVGAAQVVWPLVLAVALLFLALTAVSYTHLRLPVYFPERQDPYSANHCHKEGSHG